MLRVGEAELEIICTGYRVSPGNKRAIKNEVSTKEQ